MNEHHIKREPVAEEMEVSQSGLRHWLNGTRPIELDKFIALCKHVGADPCIILFGAPALTKEAWEKMSSGRSHHHPKRPAHRANGADIADDSLLR